jgi:hypothetical protein
MIVHYVIKCDIFPFGERVVTIVILLLDILVTGSH